MSDSMVRIVITLFFTVLFVGLATYDFVNGNKIEGILWLIMAQLYDLTTSIKWKDD